MAVHKKPSERLRERIEQAELSHRVRKGEFHTFYPRPGKEPGEPEPVACRLHPWWKPFTTGPTPPSSLCPYCKAEAEQKRSTARAEIEVPHPLCVKSTERLDAIWEDWVERSGQMQPGSIEEAQVLERIEELREEEQEREEEKLRRRRGGRVATQTIEDGRIVAYVVPPRLGRKGALGLQRHDG